MEPPVVEVSPAPREPLPRGPHGLPRDVVVRSQRSRLLGALVDYPACARAFLLEVAAAGPSALGIRDEIKQRYVDLLRNLHAGFRERSPKLPEPPVEVFRAAVAAVDDMVVRWIREGRLHELAKLEPIAVYVELALFGVPGAVRELGTSA